MGLEPLLVVGQLLVNKMLEPLSKTLEMKYLKSRRKQLLEKANQLGGSELVNKWINLHVIGEKQEQIRKIAQEAGFV